MQLVTGEPLALDLVNTLIGELDALDDPELWFAAQEGRLTLPAAPLTEVELGAVRGLREHVRVAVDAARHGISPPSEVILAINQAVRAAPPYRILGPDLTLVTGRDGDVCMRLLAELAEAAIELLADPRVGTIRACEGPNCRLLFLPTHPRRRWCSPSLCGNRVRVARYYQRHRA